MKPGLLRPSTLLIAALTSGALLVAPSAASATAHLEDLWCTSSSACVAVGSADGGEGASSTHVKRWNGSAWVAEGIDPPEGSVTSELMGVSCVSSADCTAVGSFGAEAADTRPLLLKWNGSGWGGAEIPLPAGASSAELTEVSCVSSSACVAVGSYVDDKDIEKPLAIGWDGTSWSLQSVPVPAGAGLSELAGVSCTTASDCVAVGSFVNSGAVTKTLATVWNGSAWSIASTPEPSGAELNQLYDVSCLPSDACTAVGTYFDSTGDQKTLALRRDSSKAWTIQATPNKSGALSRALAAVTCPSSTSCVATGVVELGRKEIPIAIGWNGTTWSEQAIDAEALGASAVNLTSVFCFSSTNCDAVGGVSYGRSAAPRNLAFHFNGTAWLVTEAGGYDREWVSLDTMERTSDFAAISCAAENRCVAVGRLTDDSGSLHNQVASWGAGSWTMKLGPEPSGVSGSELMGVSCPTVASCQAVGAYTDSEGVQVPLAMTWDGSTWSLREAPSPAGAKAAVLSAIDCASTSACTAVGTYVSDAGVQRPLALSFDGAGWSLASVSVPSAAGALLNSVSCTSGTSCLAVGSTVDAFGHEESLAVERAGSTWSVLDTPSLEGEAPNLLRGVSCTSSTQCFAVGSYEDIGGDPHTLAMRWDGLTWDADDGVPSGESTGLAAISCTSGTTCVAVGANGRSSTQPPTILRWDGSKWAMEPPADYPAALGGFQLAAVSCATAGDCHAAGSASYGGQSAKSTALDYEGGSWFAADATSSGAGLRGASCISAESCVAVGDSIQPAGDPATGWVLDGEDWQASDGSLAAEAFLADVSCFEESECVAVGRRGAWPYKPLAERWDGTAWSSQPMPAPVGRSANLEAVSCVAESWCAAAGFSWPTAGAGPSAPLVQTWNGSAWQIASVSMPAGAVSGSLHDIVCVSTSSCTAVGAYRDASGIHHGLIQRWNGSSWSNIALSAPSGQSYRLLGVDCTAANACTVVGSSTSTAGDTVAAIATRWNGSSLTTVTVPVPEGSTGNRLMDVDCYSSTRCVAVGHALNENGSKPFIAAWATGSWTEEEAPEPIGSGHTSLEAVSCPSAADCLAVGMSQSPGRAGEPFTVQTEGETAGESTDPVKSPSEPTPVLDAEQKDDAMEILEEDPAVQAAIGAADYDYEIGVWTENDEETGAETLVGSYVELELEESESWPERTWPTTLYDTDGHGYEAGEYQQTSVEASASNIELLQVAVDLVFDSAGNVIEGEASDVIPLALESGRVEVNEEETQYDQQIAGY